MRTPFWKGHEVKASKWKCSKMKTVRDIFFKTRVQSDNCVNYHCVKFQLSLFILRWVVWSCSSRFYDFNMVSVEIGSCRTYFRYSIGFCHSDVIWRQKLSFFTSGISIILSIVGLTSWRHLYRAHSHAAAMIISNPLSFQCLQTFIEVLLFIQMFKVNYCCLFLSPFVFRDKFSGLFFPNLQFFLCRSNSGTTVSSLWCL
jgi:hypothetical protein